MECLSFAFSPISRIRRRNFAQVVVTVKTRDYYFLILISAVAALVRLIALYYFSTGLLGKPVDVYYVDRESAKRVLEFQDPYLFSNYTNHLGRVVTFAYMPVIPAYFAPFVSIGSDVRYGSIIADVIVTIAMYFIGRSIIDRKYTGSWFAFSGSISYAILPTSIFLTSISGTNMMIGPMFLMVGLAALIEKRHIIAGILIGVALAANQFIILLFPIIALYCFRNHGLKTAWVSVLSAAAIILPFMFYSPSKFLYDVFMFQFQRPIQQNGVWDLYYLVYALSGFKLGTYLRLAIFVIPASFATVFFSKIEKGLLVGSGIISTLASVVLPVDGFLNYFLLPFTILCSLVPSILANDRLQGLNILKSVKTSSVLKIIGVHEGAGRGKKLLKLG
jgi:uncharacterized membrane protein